MKLPRYPMYVISKGRYGKTALTAKFLIRDEVPFRLVIEPQEKDLYAEAFGEDRLLILPFSNLGQGSIPARNWVWQHSKEQGDKRHWILDDNIRKLYRRWKSVRVPCQSGPAFAALEDFTDRYENIAIAGMNYKFFVTDHLPMPPFVKNCHVYSNLLIQNDIPYQWRGRYNEDTDLCLQVLAGGLCTVQFNAFLIDKATTGTMTGGNADELYQGDGRLKMARSLERMWPKVVETKRRFGRPQHVIKNAWRKFDTPLKRRADIDWNKLESSEYGMSLQEVSPVKSKWIKKLIKSSKVENKNG